MMQFLNANKMPIFGLAAAGLLLWGYFVFFGEESGPLLSSGATPSPVSQELLVTLSNLRTISLDETIFADPVFQSLNDFGVVIPPELIGRRNPFAPIGLSASAPASSATSSAESGQ